MESLEERVQKLESAFQLKRELSNSAIDLFVEELLQDPEINMYLVPDSIEKNIYTNILRLVMKALEKSLKSASINLFNHEIKMHIVPKDQ